MKQAFSLSPIKKIATATGRLWLGLWLLSLVSLASGQYDYRFGWIILAAGLAGVLPAHPLFTRPYLPCLAVMSGLLASALVMQVSPESTPGFIALVILAWLSSSLWFTIEDRTGEPLWFTALPLVLALIIYSGLLTQIAPAPLGLICLALMTITYMTTRRLSLPSTGASLLTLTVIAAAAYFIPDHGPDPAHNSLLEKDLAGAVDGRDDTTGQTRWSLFSRLERKVIETEQGRQIAEYRNRMLDRVIPPKDAQAAPSVFLEMINTLGGDERVLLVDREQSPVMQHLQTARPAARFTTLSRSCLPCGNQSGQILDRPEQLNLAELPEQGARFDKVVMIMPARQPSYWQLGNIGADYAYTGDALGIYLEAMKPRGFLVILSRDELMFQKSIIAAWQGLNRLYNGAAPAAELMWGLRRIAMNDRAARAPYQYMLLVTRTPQDAVQLETLKRLIRDMAAGARDRDIILTHLFGKGLRARQHYGHIQQRERLDYTSAYFEQLQSKRHQMFLNLDAGSFSNPAPFNMIRDLHPHLKWLMVVLPLITLALLLLPVAEKRTIDHPQSSLRAPLPVYLLMFLCSGLLVAIALSTVTALSSTVIGESGFIIPWIAATFYPGLLIGTHLISARSNGLSASIWLLVLVLCIGLFAIGMTNLSRLPFTYGVLLAAIGLPACLTATAAAQLWQVLRDTLSPLLPELQPWAELTMTTALISGTVVSAWIMPHYGVINLLKVAAVCAFIGIMLVIWARQGLKPAGR